MPSINPLSAQSDVPSAVQEKYPQSFASNLWMYIPVPISGMGGRKRHLPLPNLARAYTYGPPTRYNRKRGLVTFLLAFLAVCFVVHALVNQFGSRTRDWPKFSGDPPTLVFKREDLQQIWKWEVESGHYPSGRKIPEMIGFQQSPWNPALPPSSELPSRFRRPQGPVVTNTHRAGSKRIYLDIQSHPPNISYPPRPIPGSVADLDIVLDHCDFSQGKYVRDCLEVLSHGGGLDNGNGLRREKMDDWKYIYVETGDIHSKQPDTAQLVLQDPLKTAARDPNAGLNRKRNTDWEDSIPLPPLSEYRPYSEKPPHCDEDRPRIFHMFWAGPFTDKPYLAMLSFLYTQNTGIHTHDPAYEDSVCRPQFWCWINPGPAASVPNPNAQRDMIDELKSNPWAAPFLHPRFKDVIHFKLWNTTEQLDGIPELKSEWRALQDTLFNSGGHRFKAPAGEQVSRVSASHDITTSLNAAARPRTRPRTSPTRHVSNADQDDIFNRMGSKSSSSYDRLSVILSDMARFVLCHRFGGIYIDADTIFLRDWEELWGWRGAFAYRWSRLERYNTAVLKLNKGSALGSFLFRTALKNLLDFHPMTVYLYIRDAFLENLLLRLPDALFDSAWLNTEYYQRDRPPQPHLTDFEHFFETPAKESAAPRALGFNGFFKGAYSYHFHNFWWKPFDPSRNWPELGPRFLKGELVARAATMTNTTTKASHVQDDGPTGDKRDLSWATVLKRTCEAYIRGEIPNMYGEWIEW